jgi:protein disulfide-isomerase A1
VFELTARDHHKVFSNYETLVMYYAPWCGHCKKLAPVWSELADSVKGSDLIIAKLDSTEEKISDPKVESYPTIFYYPK